jgi:hypothetical protein
MLTECQGDVSGVAGSTLLLRYKAHLMLSNRGSTANLGSQLLNVFRFDLSAQLSFNSDEGACKWSHDCNNPINRLSLEL